MPELTILLALTGIVTAGPRLGVFVYREPFDTPRLIGFLLIWAALAIYSVDLARAVRNRAAAVAAEAPA